jgi:hypothetical protein
MMPSDFSQRTLQDLGFHRCALGGGGEFAAGEGLPEQANKRGGCDLAHPKSVGGGGSAGDGSDEWRRSRYGSKSDAMWGDARLWVAVEALLGP